LDKTKNEIEKLDTKENIVLSKEIPHLENKNPVLLKQEDFKNLSSLLAKS
jgi:hypothetical protein